MRPKSRVAVWVVVFALAMTGCAATGTVEAQQPQVTGLITSNFAPSEANNLAQTAGTLVLDNECLRFEDGTIPVFPEGAATWDGTSLSFAGSDYALGDEFIAGGGELVNEIRDNVVPANCGDGPGWGVAVE